MEDGFFGQTSTGMKSIREVEEYVVHPNEMKALAQGQLFAISRTVDPRYAFVRIPVAQEYKAQEVSTQELKAHFQAIRQTYLQGRSERYLDLSKAAAPGLTTRPGREEEKHKNLEPELWS